MRVHISILFAFWVIIKKSIGKGGKKDLYQHARCPFGSLRKANFLNFLLPTFQISMFIAIFENRNNYVV